MPAIGYAPRVVRAVVRAVVVTALAAAGALLDVAPAGAEFPGRNGRIYFTTPNRADFGPSCGVASVSPAGTRYECVEPGGFDPSVSADGRLIAEVRPGDPVQVYTVQPDGTRIRRLTRTTFGDNFAPTFSPDRRRIFYFLASGNDNGVYVMSADGSGQRQLTTDSGFGPVASPDGTQIAYYQSPGISLARSDGSGSHVILANQRTTKVSPIGTTATVTRSLVTNSEPNWAPSGRQLAFTRRATITSQTCNLTTGACTSTGSDATDVWTASADGTGLRQLTATPGVEESEASWSPDGRQIAYFRHRHDDADGVGEIWVMNADGSGKHAVARGWHPYWSSVQRTPPAPRLKTRIVRLHPNRRCLKLAEDAIVLDITTKALKETRFDITVYLDGKFLDAISDARDEGTPPTFVRRGRHKVKFVVTDAAMHERPSRTVTFRGC